jgi:hypothetical protein
MPDPRRSCLYREQVRHVCQEIEGLRGPSGERATRPIELAVSLEYDVNLTGAANSTATAAQGPRTERLALVRGH